MSSIFDTDQLPGRAINDTKSTRKAVFDSALSAAQSIKPISNQTHTLELSDPHYVGPEEFSHEDHKAAIVNGTSLGRRLKATYTLRDNATGTVVAQKKRTLATVPYYTDSGTFVDNGTEYTLANQLRLKPGVYTRVKANGEVEAHCNPLPGAGVPHRVFLDPKSGIFRVKIGQAQLPLVPMLRSLGATDDDIKKAWGPNLAAVNLQKTSAADLSKLYERLVRKATAATPAEQQEQIRQALEATKLDLGSTEKTLGKPFGNVSLDSLLTTTRKLLAVHNSSNPEMLQKLGLTPAEEDDRDNLAHMQLVGPEDIIAERIRGGAKLLNQVLWKAARNGNLSSTTAGLLNRAVRGAFLDTGLGGVSEGINPGQLFDQQMRVTRMGTGGISADAIPATARSVQGSHLGYIDPVLTPESLSAGVDSRLSYHVRKGPNGEIYAPFMNAASNQVEWKRPEDLYHAVIAFPGELEKAAATGDDTVYGMRRGRMGSFPRSQVAYSVPTMEHAFSPLANTVPMKSGMKGQRVAMAARMSTQALPLINAEAPLVQSGIPGTDRSFESLYGSRMGAIRSDKSGQVLSVQPHQIEVRYDDGTAATIPLSQYRPNNRKTMFHQEPTVQVGQRFDSGSVLAKSNYTDAAGTSALGLNARVGYAVARGANFEDAIALSESLAKRLSSQHLYQHPVEFTETTHRVGKKGWAGIFPGKYRKPQLEALDDDGVITPGRVVEYGDPLVLVADKRDRRVGSVSGARAGSFSDQTTVWTHHTPGVVTDVSKTNKGVNVAVHTVMPLQVGDKVSNRFGGKGVVGRVIPDHEMPVGDDGKPLELLLNPLGVISRGNPNQVVETILGKIAAKTGKPYVMPDFQNSQDLVRFAEQELAKHGMKDLEDLHDPVTGQKIPQVLTGNTFLMKLHHTAESKEGGRAFGAYTADGTPAKGGPEGAKTWGMLHLNALLSHGAMGVIDDAHRVRGQRNTAYWAAVMSGRTPPDPPPSFTYDKFLNYLRGAGINPVRNGSSTHLMALTNKDIDALAGDRAIQNAETVDWNHANLRPVVGGLFDEKIFGGAAGSRWGKIPLDEPMPNPVMEEPIRRVLGLKTAEFRDVIAGKKELHGQTGPQAIATALDRIDLPKELEKVKYTIANGRKTERDTAIRKAGFLMGAAKTGVHPREWMWNSAPVLPPQFRPISKMSNGVPMVADANYLYRELFEAKKLAKQSRDAFGDNGEERLNLYDNLKAVAGLGDPVSDKLQQQEVKGLLSHVIGKSPKTGMMQRRLLGLRADLVGRATVIPNPNLDMDSIAIPENMAWSIYRPFITKHLVQRGMTPLRAATAIAERHEAARNSLLEVMKTRPVIVDRSPVWHRYGIMAFHPQITSGHNIETNVVVNKGYNLDHDGDAMQVHVPATDKAVQDAYEKMLPSKNLLDVATFRPHMVPSQEFLDGLYSASTGKSSNRPLQFARKLDALRAFWRGEIGADQEVHILNE